MANRNPLAKGLTFAALALRQMGRRREIAAGIEERAARPFAIEGDTIVLRASDAGWRATGVSVKAGERFMVSARGAVWLSKPMAIAMEPKLSLWVRIGHNAPIAKMLDADCVFTAWADGEVEIFLKAFSEWASPAGDLMSPARPAMAGEIGVRVAKTELAPSAANAPAGWRYLWRLGEGTIYAQRADGQIDIDTLADVGILQAEVDAALTPETRLDWRWCVQELPSSLPEDLQPTHDYLSVAVEFEDGRDLTYMWSAGLPHDHIFACPLPYWCDRETHWVLRTPKDGLGRWIDESRSLQADAVRAYGQAPKRVVRLWLIANSVFQRQRGRASVAGLQLR